MRHLLTSMLTQKNVLLLAGEGAQRKGCFLCFFNIALIKRELTSVGASAPLVVKGHRSSEKKNCEEKKLHFFF